MPSRFAGVGAPVLSTDSRVRLWRSRPDLTTITLTARRARPFSTARTDVLESTRRRHTRNDQENMTPTSSDRHRHHRGPSGRPRTANLDSYLRACTYNVYLVAPVSFYRTYIIVMRCSPIYPDCAVRVEQSPPYSVSCYARGGPHQGRRQTIRPV